MTYFFDVFLRLPKLRLCDTNQGVLRPFNEDDNREETAEPTDKEIGEIIKNEKGFKGTIPRGTHNTLDATYESLVSFLYHPNFQGLTRFLKKFFLQHQDFSETSSAVKRKFDLEHVNHWSWHFFNDSIRWLIIIPIGFFTALVALSIEQGIHHLAT
jgi:hypothetical protein